ncbi:hypothetical protein OROHE_024091 [Orobanche hederae]
MWKRLLSWILKGFPLEGSTMGSPQDKRKTGHGHGHVDEGSTMDSAEGKRKAGHVALCARVAKKREKIARRLEKRKISRRFLQGRREGVSKGSTDISGQ